jgi:predicted AAA+ superfamily ATPase
MKRKCQILFEKHWADPRELIQVVVGPRQVGKTTTLESLTAGDASCIFASADTPSPPTAEFIVEHWNQTRAIRSPRRILVLDEIQKIPRWSEIVKGLWDEDKRKKLKIRVGLLGSAALLIEKGLSESLAGRFELHRFPHWSFGECRQAFDIKLKQFLTLGGYPKTYDLLDNEDRAQNYIQNSIVEPSLGRDILSMHAIEKPALLRQLFGYVSKLPSQIVSFQKILAKIQGSGNAATLMHYADLLEMAFLIKGLARYSAKAHRTKRSIPKWIVMNSGLVDSKVKSSPTAHGFVVENAVGAHILNLAMSKSSIELHYWRENSKEIDFILTDQGLPICAIEVKAGKTNQEDESKFYKTCDGLGLECPRLLLTGERLETFLSTSEISEILKMA